MTQPDFDETIERINTHSQKWDGMATYHGVSPDDGIPMWVADMDFRPPDVVQQAVQAMADHGIYGYFGDDSEYLSSIAWWMKERHQWAVEKEWIFTTAGLVNGTAMCVDAFTEPGDGVILMTPVYHAFARVINSAGRQVVECQLPITDGQYQLDIPAWQSRLTGKEKLLILCSPHNRVAAFGAITNCANSRSFASATRSSWYLTKFITIYFLAAINTRSWPRRRRKQWIESL